MTKLHQQMDITVKKTRFFRSISHILSPLINAMTPGMMMRTRANILMKVKVICVRDAMVTLQQFTATTDATETRERQTAGQREVYIWTHGAVC